MRLVRLDHRRHNMPQPFHRGLPTAAIRPTPQFNKTCCGGYWDARHMDVKSNMDKVCIIGAGSSGLAAAKTFQERGIPFDCLEREHDIGGLWNEATDTGVVYDTAFLVSSRKYTGFEDYPFPEEYPTYPSHRETLAYL